MKKSDIKLVEEFVCLVGATTWEIKKTPCTGKWRGTNDYGIVLNGNGYNNKVLFVSNGIKNFGVILAEKINVIKRFNEKKDYYLDLVRKQAEKDNKTAENLHLKNVVVEDVGILSPDADWVDMIKFHVVMNVNGKRFKFCETSLHYSFIKDILEKHFEDVMSRDIFVAGGLNSWDFVFCNVMHNSENSMYKILPVAH